MFIHFKPSNRHALNFDMRKQVGKNRFHFFFNYILWQILVKVIFTFSYLCMVEKAQFLNQILESEVLMKLYVLRSLNQKITFLAVSLWMNVCMCLFKIVINFVKVWYSSANWTLDFNGLVCAPVKIFDWWIPIFTTQGEHCKINPAQRIFKSNDSKRFNQS